MSAITPERITQIRTMPHDNWRVVHELLDALESSRAEVQRLTEEARRSDAGRVEGPEIGALLLERIEVRSKGYVEMAAMLNDWIKTNSRLSPSPQPSADVVVVVPREEWNILNAFLDDWRAPESRSLHDWNTSLKAKAARINALRSSTNDETRG